ncbi:MAG: DUF4013 domain-containing protein [Candidatus Dojkabacteria bacterium]|jgi:hypothetical protein|nr:DUF4013 domain-containing protein [Candidatus Dojkabacteria bacterium]
MTTKQTIDIEKSLKSFFELPDWVERSLMLGGVYAALYIIYFGLIFIFIIPFIGWIIGCLGFIVIFFVAMAFWIYTIGYKYELIQAEMSDKPFDDIKIFENYKERLTHGGKIYVGNLIYSIPVIILYFIGYALMFLPMGILGSVGETDNEALGLLALPSMGLMLIGYLPLGIALLYQMFQAFFITPTITALYVKEQSISAMLKFKNVWAFIRANFVNLLLLMALTMGIGFVLYFASMISMFLVIICIGIILFPAVLGIGATYVIHMQASIIGQIAKQN